MLRKQQARQFQRVLAAIQDLCWEPTGLLSLFPEMGFLIPFYTHTHTQTHTNTILVTAARGRHISCSGGEQGSAKTQGCRALGTNLFS